MADTPTPPRLDATTLEAIQKRWKWPQYAFDQHEADRLLAHARTDIPALLDELALLRVENRRLRAENERMRHNARVALQPDECPHDDPVFALTISYTAMQVDNERLRRVAEANPVDLQYVLRRLRRLEEGPTHD